jgi:hypothetical protein
MTEEIGREEEEDLEEDVEVLEAEEDLGDLEEEEEEDFLREEDHR